MTPAVSEAPNAFENDMRQTLRDEIAERLAFVVMHANHARDYAEYELDGLLSMSVRSAAIYMNAVLGSLEDLRRRGQS